MQTVMIDVRETDEFLAESIDGSIHIPLSEFSRRAPALLRSYGARNIQLVCRSGNRAQLAANEAAAFGCDCEIVVLPGGIEEWKRQGKPVVSRSRARLPILRQVQLVAGLLILAGVTLAHFAAPEWIYLPAFVGVGLTTAGLTGFCGMAELLARMPWNRHGD